MRSAIRCSLALLLLVLVAAVTSCHRRPLEDEFEEGEYAEILLQTDWKLLDEKPTGISAYFFPEDGSSPTQLMSNNIWENTVRLRRGRYKVLVFNQIRCELQDVCHYKDPSYTSTS